MKKRTQLWIILFAFLFGQLIQLLTCAMAQYLYVSDPVMMCATVGIVTVILAVTTSVFTLMNTEEEKVTYSQAKHRQSDGMNRVIKPIFKNAREGLPLDTDSIDITKEDENIRKENEKALKRA